VGINSKGVQDIIPERLSQTPKQNFLTNQNSMKSQLNSLLQSKNQTTCDTINDLKKINYTFMKSTNRNHTFTNDYYYKLLY